MRDPPWTPVMGLVTLPLSILPPLTPNVIVTLSLADKHALEMRDQADNGCSLLG